MTHLKIRVFGAFRQFVPSGFIEISLDSKDQMSEALTIDQIKATIISHLQELAPNFNDKNLVYESVLATQDEILQGADRYDGSSELALLPPVCGG